MVEKFPAPPEAPGGAEGGAKKGQNMVQVNWLLNEEAMGAKEQLTLAVLDYLLMGTSSSDLRKALTDSQLGNEVIGGGLSDELSQATFRFENEEALFFLSFKIRCACSKILKLRGLHSFHFKWAL